MVSSQEGASAMFQMSCKNRDEVVRLTTARSVPAWMTACSLSAISDSDCRFGQTNGSEASHVIDTESLTHCRARAQALLVQSMQRFDIRINPARIEAVN